MRRFALIICCCLAAACIAVAGFSTAYAQQPSALDKRWPGDPEPQPQQKQQPAQSQPQQKQQPAQLQQESPQPQSPQPGVAAPRTAPRAKAARAQPAPSKPKPRPVQQAHAVTCSGLFGKDASQAKLATAFGATNVSWEQVDGPGSTKLNATVLFPHDPKRRLEVLWNSEESHSDTQVVAINGQSTWTAPKGVKIGMTIAALEKLNGKPFSVNGFRGDNGGLATSWNGGALEKLPDSCKVGVRLAPDPKAPAPANGEVDVLTSDSEFLSNAPGMKALAPKITEIIIGY